MSQDTEKSAADGVKSANRKIRRILAEEFFAIDFAIGDDDPPGRVYSRISAGLPSISRRDADRVVARFKHRVTDAIRWSNYDSAYNVQMQAAGKAFHKAHLSDE